jgi:hypothetical protein
MVNTPAMQHRRKQKQLGHLEGEIQEALIQADTSCYDSFRLAIYKAATLLTENPDLFPKKKAAFDEFKKPAPLVPFEKRCFALYLHSLIVGREFHEHTDERRKLEAAVDAEINPVRRRELERELDRHVAPVEKEKVTMTPGHWEALARLSTGTIGQRKRGRTRRLRIGPWHVPMTQVDYGVRLGLSDKAVRDLIGKLVPKAKRLSQSRRNEPVCYAPETNWRVLAAFLKQTKRGERWKQDYCLDLLDYYRRNPDAKSIKMLSKVFAGTKFPPELRKVITDFFLGKAVADPVPQDPFTALLRGNGPAA